MPHLVVEYTDNLSAKLDISGLLNALHDATVETGVFPLKGIRTRAIKHDTYIIADKNPANAFIHVIARIGAGRDEATKQAAGDRIFKALTGFTADIFADTPIGLGFEFVEIRTWKKNSICERPPT